MNSPNSKEQQNLFYNWMSKRDRDDGTPYREATIKAYITPLRSGLKKMINCDSFPCLNVFECISIKDFNDLYALLLKQDDLKKIEDLNKALKLYLEFLTNTQTKEDFNIKEEYAMEVAQENCSMEGVIKNNEEKIVYTDRKDYPLSTILEMYNDGDIITQPDYQRDYIMDDKKASKLIESVLLQIPIPTIYLCEENDSRSSVIDGQQRLTSFVRYLSNEFKLTGLEEISSLNGKYFKDLEKSYQRKIKQTSISSIVIKKESQDLKYEIFARLNQGSVKLKPQELRNCIYRGSLNNLLESIAKENSLLTKMFHGENTRKQYQEYILRFFALRNYQTCASSLKKTMNDYMAKNQNLNEEEINKLKTLFNSKIDIIKQIFGEHAFCGYDRLNNKITSTFSGSIYDSLIIPCSYFDNHTLIAHADALRQKFEETKISNQTYQDYTYAATGSKHRVIGRIKLIYDLIYEIVNNHKTKRLFDGDIKELLWEKGNHICPYCNQLILSIDDAEVDHILPYSKGGDTVLENAQLLHRHCNRTKNNSEIETVDWEDEE